MGDGDSLADAKSIGGRRNVDVVRSAVAIGLLESTRHRLGRLLETSREALVILAEVDTTLSARSPSDHSPSNVLSDGRGGEEGKSDELHDDDVRGVRMGNGCGTVRRKGGTRGTKISDGFCMRGGR